MSSPLEETLLRPERQVIEPICPDAKIIIITFVAITAIGLIAFGIVGMTQGILGDWAIALLITGSLLLILDAFLIYNSRKPPEAQVATEETATPTKISKTTAVSSTPKRVRFKVPEDGSLSLKSPELARKLSEDGRLALFSRDLIYNSRKPPEAQGATEEAPTPTKISKTTAVSSTPKQVRFQVPEDGSPSLKSPELARKLSEDGRLALFSTEPVPMAEHGSITDEDSPNPSPKPASKSLVSRQRTPRVNVKLTRSTTAPNLGRLAIAGGASEEEEEPDTPSPQSTTSQHVHYHSPSDSSEEDLAPYQINELRAQIAGNEFLTLAEHGKTVFYIKDSDDPLDTIPEDKVNVTIDILQGRLEASLEV